MYSSLERNEESQELNRHFAAIPGPNDKYLGRVCNKADEAEDKVDEKKTSDASHGGKREKSHTQKRQLTADTVVESAHASFGRPTSSSDLDNGLHSPPFIFSCSHKWYLCSRP